MAKELELLCVVVARQSLLVRLHIQNVQEDLAVTVLLASVSVGPGRGLHGVEGRAVDTEARAGVGCLILVEITDVLLENLHPNFTVLVQYILQVVLLIWQFGELHLVGQIGTLVEFRVIVAAGDHRDCEVLHLTRC